MIRKVCKKTSLLVGILVTGLVSPIGGYISSNYSKDGSFLVPVAKADIPVDPFGSVNPLDPSIIGGDSGSGGGSGGGGGCSSSSCGCCCE